MIFNKRVSQVILTTAAIALVWVASIIKARATDNPVKSRHVAVSTGSLGMNNDEFWVPTQGTFKVTSIPEATTIIAGAALLLPFAASTIRPRKSRTAS